LQSKLSGEWRERNGRENASADAKASSVAPPSGAVADRQKGKSRFATSALFRGHLLHRIPQPFSFSIIHFKNLSDEYTVNVLFSQ
jgi:hypothetical protein